MSDEYTQDEQNLPPPKFTIHIILDDFPIDVQIVGSAKRLRNALKSLREIGAVAPAAARQARTERAREAPICPYHGPMKESTKRPGTWYCSHKMGDGSYCKERA